MVDVQPFRAIRPNEQLAFQVACLPYDVIDTNEARVDVSWRQHLRSRS